MNEEEKKIVGKCSVWIWCDNPIYEEDKRGLLQSPCQSFINWGRAIIFIPIILFLAFGIHNFSSTDWLNWLKIISSASKRQL